MLQKSRTATLPTKGTMLSFAELYSQIKQLSFQSAEALQKAYAEAFVEEALRTYWIRLQTSDCTQSSFPEYSPAGPKRHISDEVKNLASSLGETVATLPVLDAAHQIGLIYTSLLPKEYRARHGIYYTPSALANRLLDQVEKAGIDWSTCKILDPACGGSAFLVPAASRMIDSLSGSEPAIVLQNLSARLVGWELDPFAAWLSSIFIEAQCMPVSTKAGRQIRPKISIRDSLNCSLEKQEFDLVVGNPPFGRTRLPNKIRRRFQRSLFGHANLYGVFTELAVRLAKPNGLVAFITPASFLGGEYFKNLRSFLWEEAPPIKIDFVKSRKDVFEGVLQETVLGIYHKGGKHQRASVSLIHPLSDGHIEVEHTGNFCLPMRPTAPWIIPRRTKDKALTQNMQSMPHRLADWGYKVSTGPLVWNRYKNQLRDKNDAGCVPLIWAECVVSGGRFKFRHEKRNHKPYFFLHPKKDDWLKVKRPCVLLQRTTAKEQNRRLIAAAMPKDFIDKHGGVTVENHLNMLLPVDDPPLVTPEALSAFLNSTVADRAFRCLSGSVAVSAYELESMPLPDPAKLKLLNDMVTQKASSHAIERVCLRLYGIDHK